MRALDAKVDYLVDASRRLGQKDWVLVAVTVIGPYILNVLLPPPEAARAILIELFGPLCMGWRICPRCPWIDRVGPVLTLTDQRPGHDR